MKQSSFACKIIIILALVLYASRGASHVQSADPAISRVYLPLVNVSPAPVRIAEADLSFYRGGNLFLIGDVTNTSDYPVYDITIEARLYDVNDHLLDTSTGTTVLTATLPGQLNPFYVITHRYDYDTPPVSRWEATITGWSLNSNQTYRPATTTITQIEYDGISTRVDVEVRNDGAEPLMDVKGVAWSLDQRNGLGRYTVAVILAPSETVTFTEFLSVGWTQTIKAAAQGYIVP